MTPFQEVKIDKYKWNKKICNNKIKYKERKSKKETWNNKTKKEKQKEA